MRIQSHGGHCCGVRHYFNFNNRFSGAKQDRETISSELRPYEISEGGRTRGKLIEAIVTDSQFRADPDLAQALKDNGFKLVNRFSNSTGGLCNVLHRTGGRRDFTKGRQPKWVRILRDDSE